jgi:hypothetical protein
MKAKTLILQVFCIFLLASCTKNDTLKENVTIKETNPLLTEKTAITMQRNGKTYKAEKLKADYITNAKSGKLGQTVYFKDVGNKQIGIEFIPGDPFRGGRTNITYTIDNEITTDNGLTFTEIESAIDAAMNTWDQVKCSDLKMTKVDFNGNLGFYSALFGFGGSFNIVADIQHSGFLPSSFFDVIAPGGSVFILAVTIPFIWVDENGTPTDFDRNGKLDYAFAEIYYNDGFDWSNNPETGFDIQTVALHESGHGLGQAHFGKAFSTNKNGKLHFAPRAVMNAAYSGEQRTISGTDKGGHCSIWGSWPNN